MPLGLLALTPLSEDMSACVEAHGMAARQPCSGRRSMLTLSGGLISCRLHGLCCRALPMVLVPRRLHD